MYWQSFANVVLPQALSQELTVIKGYLTTQPRLHPQALATIMQTHPIGNPRIFLDRMTLLFHLWRTSNPETPERRPPS